ncbi:MAG TPA: alpha/beta hydrolase [Caulobacteraceae bacterium]|jgi:pimeloyl-ACP methyl ester carboxylesterase
MPQDAQSPTLRTADGVDLFHRDWGEGRPVVFVHGWAVTCDVWQYQQIALSASARCIAYDKRGHGRSSDPGRGYDYDTLADDLAAVLDGLDLEDAILVGHSMGPAEIVRYLSRHGAARVSRLVLISSALPFMLKTPDNPDGIDGAMFAKRRQAWRRDMPKFLAENARAIMTPDTSAETVAWVADMGAQASLKALFDLNHAITETDLRGDVGRVRLPTLLIHGGQDKSAPLDLTSRRLAAMIPGSELKVYDEAPHALPVTHPDQLTEDLEAWVRR